jgi:hypothetical protein
MENTNRGEKKGNLAVDKAASEEESFVMVNKFEGTPLGESFVMVKPPAAQAEAKVLPTTLREKKVTSAVDKAASEKESFVMVDQIQEAPLGESFVTVELPAAPAAAQAEAKVLPTTMSSTATEKENAPNKRGDRK